MNGIMLLRALRRLASRRGWVIEVRAGKGSHMRVILNGLMTVVPQHRADLKRGTFRAILKQLALTETDLEE